MLVWVQGSPFHIAAGSHPVQEAWGHKIVCTGSNSKVASMLSRTIPSDTSCYNNSEKYSLTYLRRTVSQLLKERSKVKFLALQGSNS